MNCQEFWALLPQQKGATPLDPGDACRAHLERCTACAERFERHARLTESLALAAGEYRRVQAPPRLEARLLRAFRQSVSLPDAPPQRSPWTLVGLWAAAATMLLAAGLLLLGSHQPVPTVHLRPAGLEWADWSVPGAGSDSGDPSSLTGEFLPIPNASRWGVSEEDLDLVRMEVPRSAMIAFGIPVTAEHAMERVEADVLVGHDGLARAVRFLD